MATHPSRILLTAGSNAKGQLGIGSQDDAHTFTPCQFAGCVAPNQLPDAAARVAHIACGANHTVLLLKHHDGATSLWGTGDGGSGQLGPGYPREREEPTASTPWTVFRELAVPETGLRGRGYTHKHVAASWETTYVVLSHPGRSDVLLSMGSNAFGALGVGEEADVAVSHGGDRCGPGGPQVVDLALGCHDGLEQSRAACLHVHSLHAGPRHVVAQLSVAGHPETVLVGWGASRHGQLGQNGGMRCVARPTRLPIRIDDDPVVSCALGNRHTVVLHASGRVSALGSDRQGQIPSFGLPSTRGLGVCRLGCTWNGTYAQTVSGGGRVLLAMGSNAQGQLGRGDTVAPTSAGETVVGLPVDQTMSSFVCGSEHVLAALSGPAQEGDSVVGWGWNEHGNMGLGTLGNVTIPTWLWPREDIKAYNKYPQRVVGIWAGCATSWLLVE